MRVTRFTDIQQFAGEAGTLIERDQAANNLVLGIVQSLLDRPDSYAEASCWVVDHEGKPVGAAIRTPPYNVVLADPLHVDAIDALAERLATDQPSLPGVTANTPWVSRFADRWVATTGATARITIAQGVYALRSVSAPRPAEGAPRPATSDDRPLLERWMHEFEAEALAAMVRDEHAVARDIDARLDSGDSIGFTLWTIGARPVSICGWTRIPGGARVGPVYTPKADRRRGFASNLVADVSSRMLAGGAEACFLYTDLGNATSNGIYRALGYEQVSESLMIAFER
ncbi:MAG TPA: GNAT family N-acetyltransferase [Actinomycetota bacterium]|nr:GNAT family N-acetyltransferase [Actinomycetota bacterium]